MPETTQFGAADNGSRDDGSLKANTILMNRYRIMGLIGGGGQGAVYQARDLNFPDAKRLVAVKEMHYSTGDPGVRAATMATFQREANILATLAHPAIPKIFDFFDQNNRAYLIQEYINGSDLELLLTKTKELPINKVIEWAIDLCDVLHYLHSQPEPIIFRDMKPSNIMIDSLGKVRLIDFGIAKIFVSGVKNTMIGTEGYSAPEQYKGDVNPLSDIYGLGATLHHVLTRKDPRLEPPFSFNERPIPEFNQQASPGLIAIIDKALQMEPSNRFQNCAEMKEALERLRYAPAAVNMTAARPALAGGPVGTSLFDDMDGTAGAIEPRWKFKTEDEIRGGPTAYKNLAFVGSYDTNVWAVDLETGAFKWKYPTTGGIAVTPVFNEKHRLVFFGSEDNNFSAVDFQSGRIAWSYTTGDKIRSTARVSQEYVFFGSDDGRVYALVAGNGRYLWEYDTGGPVRGQPYVSRDLIIVGSEAGELIALELSGSKKWAYRLRRGINASPIVDEIENICYVGGMDGYMYAVDASSGYSMWRFRTNGPIISAAALDRELLFFGSADGYIYALNAESSKEKWRFNTEHPVVAAPAVYDGKVYAGSTDGYFYCLDIKTGKEVWKFKAEKGITSAPFITDNVILVGSMDQTLYALPLIS
ncbi:MAG: PQQ-binding-like beta-propeller repeat protein [Anaerolineae bacterium]